MTDIRSLQDIRSELSNKIAKLSHIKFPDNEITVAACARHKIQLLREIQAMLLPFVDAEYEALSRDEEL